MNEFQNTYEPSWTAQEAAEYLRIPVKSLQRLARAGRVPAKNYNGKWFFLRSELDAWRACAVISASPSVPHRRFQ
jgi:excisionase family DNA binding protein